MVHIAVTYYQFPKTLLIRRLNRGTYHIVSAFRIICTEHGKRVKIKTVGIDFALYSVHLLSASLNYKIHLTPGFISPIVNSAVIHPCTQCIEHKMFPQESAVFLPDAVPAFCKSDKTSVKGIAFWSLCNLTSPAPMKGREEKH